MTVAKKLVVCAVVALLPLLVAADIDDDMCYNSEVGYRTLPADCPHDCCWGHDCGSKSECDRALIIGLVVGGSVLCCCFLSCVLFCYCTQRLCFGSKETTTVIYSQAPQQHYGAGPYHQRQQQQYAAAAAKEVA